MTNIPLTQVAASRFYTRWINADDTRTQKVAEVAKLSLNPDVFARILQNETDSGVPLPAAMRRLRNLVIATLIRRDLSGQADLAEVVDTMTAFGDFAVQTHLAAVMAEQIAIHGTPIGAESGAPQEMIVLGMGKLGGGELNVSSDIDLIFVYPEDGETVVTTPEQRQLSNHEFFTRLGKKLIAALSEITEDGFTFRVDMALRPNGASGPLAASFNMVEEYLIVQGREWERYAWVKARALTGNPADIEALDKIVRPFVYRRYLDYGSIDAIRNMHAQIRAEVTRQEARHPDRSNNVKLGRGGIREIEFLAQVFQLIRGGRDAALRDRSTRRTLHTLAEKQLFKPEVVEQLLHAYTFLRNLEHRLQYLDDAQTHTLPANEADRLIVAQMMGYNDVASLLAALEEQRTLVATQFDEIFSDKTSDNANDENVDAELSAVLSDSDNAEAIETYLTSLSFDHAADGAKRLLATWHSPRLQSLPEASRNKLVALVNASLPIIAKVTETRSVALNRLLNFFEAIARRAAYLALLTEYPHALERVIRMIAASDWAAQYLTRHPILLDELLDDRTLKAAPDWNAFAHDCRARLDETPGDTERQMDVLREMHHAQLIRLLAQDLVGDLSVERLADHLTELADRLVAETIHAIWKMLPNRHREEPKFSVIAYGKLGGKELGYASDLDVIFLYDDDDQDAPALYAKLAQRFITWMTAHTPAGILFDVDIALRPDGASGLLVSTVSSFEKYQTNSAWPWEHQALTRARFCAGDSDIGARFEAIRINVLRQTRDPAKLKKDVLEMRKKLHDAHPNRTDLFDLKHDDGGMIDIEFMVQFLVLRDSAQHAGLTGDIGNIALLKLCGELGLIDTTLAGKVADAYRVFRKLQHQVRLQGAERARVDQERVAKEIAAVTALWDAIFA
ncbi:bifunctional [glutamate--ammonia ligase]-adenylyl-L-tyrosine phosphorylase/[glutamate--ammonia-ligase] adenylyltransferase [Herminiimonas arsenitoxidans]|uniref:bifunctional [glutamate--ammonia ligase]-adenylyl-L-tyrosine phosphorylase/[glutamate--ammonia-ligase] adenylyltransferase n=1 Tax=Herminiimonas arsenitoxidans TaxID=1809410 RepID=UPI000970A9A9|nr:bifunctional [glutamate--ammonia ligase]-adenylyl-L-tyrosine phosphorylase/[glutamate--ammonia-ligase] adenylyltransferase [Herminiimonas arsenitoxidans]